ncbi:MAG: iron-sulfur cluster-binding protein [Chloroflexi bacterium]|nr:iron-sulfur cluster-binding protein [Chloroflexota bacterium]
MTTTRQSTTPSFKERVRLALGDRHLRTALQRATGQFERKRAQAFAELSDPELLRDQARAAREHAIAHLPELLERLEAEVTAHGGVVHWAEDAAQAHQIVLDLAQSHGVRRIVKGKSMVSEEIGLNQALQSAGLEVTETDLGEFIIQLAGEMPSHIVVPAVHKRKEDIADIFERHLDVPRTLEPEVLTETARRRLRRYFLRADMGITGVNFAVAETGTLAIITNEGNGRFVTSLPPLHVAIMGIEKVIATLEDLILLVQILPRSATGQKMTTYVSLINGPARPGDPDGPEELHLILLDNGRSHIIAEGYTEALYCIRCGACLNSCPVYREIGGHAYGWVYPGPIGAVVTPLLQGFPRARELPNASSLCGACRDVCPVRIDLPRLLLKLRSELTRTGLSSRWERWAIRGWRWIMASPARYRWAGRLAAWGTLGLARRGWIRRLPPPLNRWTRSRDFPAPAVKPFRERWAKREARP